jgi:hypothetical protein
VRWDEPPAVAAPLTTASTTDDLREAVLWLPWRQSWQHKNEAHLDCCPRNYYYIAACSDACVRAWALVVRAGVTLDPGKLPNSGRGDRGGSLENYG